jgi:hypothetical protein
VDGDWWIEKIDEWKGMSVPLSVLPLIARRLSAAKPGRKTMSVAHEMRARARNVFD